MKILGNTKSKTQKMKMVKMFLVVLIHCNTVNNNYQQNSRVLYTFTPSKSFGQLLVISPKNFIFLKTFDSEFSILKYGSLIKILNR